MKTNRSVPMLSMIALASATLFVFVIPMWGQEAPKAGEAPAAITVGNVQITGLPDDWTHHHLVFSNPGTEEDAYQKGRHDQWLKVVNDPRYIIQQLKRHAPAQGPADDDVASIEEEARTNEAARTEDLSASAAEALGVPGTKRSKTKIKKDWSAGMDGTAAAGTGTITTNNAGSSSSISVGGQTISASAPTAASDTGTFTGNPTNGQTVTVGGSEVLTASLGTAATATITIGSSFCIAPGQGVDVDGTTFTTNATAGTGTVVVDTVPSAGDTVVIGGVTYTFETTLSSGGPANQVLVPTSNTSGNRTITAENLSVAINNSGTCGSTSGGVCTRNVSAVNPQVSSTDNSSATQTLTALCADNAAITGTSDGTKVTVNTVAAASSAGTNSSSGLIFALNTSGSTTTPASQSLTATNLVSVINGNSTTSGILTAASGGAGIVNLTANTWGTAGNSYTLTDNATSGVTLATFASKNTGTSGTNTGTSFAIDNVNADAATNLASAIARNGGTVGVTATSSSATVTVTASAAGSSGNSITLAEGLSNFTWSGSTLSGGSDGTTSASTFAYWSGAAAASTTQLASNIATAINDNTTLGGTAGVTAASATCGSNQCVDLTANSGGTSGNSIATPAPTSFSGLTWGHTTLTGGVAGTGRVQPNTYPAKYGVSLTQASCADYVIYPTGQAGGTNIASIIAYNNLYTTGCSGAVPSFYWGYNTGGTATTSPILSEDGTQVAFIQVSGTAASLVLLKWAAGPTATLTSQSSGSSYRSCNAPCMYTLAFANGKNDTFSAPFYDYGHDLLYVGDDSGNLHQFSGVFNGSPAESTSPWPVALGSNKVSSPVYDCDCGFQGGYVFVGDFGGVFYGVGTGYGGTTNGQVHGNTGSIGDVIADAPLVDSSEGIELVFVTTGSAAWSGDNAVFEFVSSFTDYGTPGSVYAGTGGAGYYLYAGDFDNVYYDSGNPAYGHLYVVGNTGTAGGATLYQLPIAYSSLTGASNAVVTGLNSTEHPFPSPLTEFCNNGVNACAITSQRSVTVKVSTTSPELTILDGSGTFSSTDVGAYVSGTDIDFASTISSVLNSTTANLSTAPTASVSSESVAIQGGQTTSGNDYVFFSIEEGAESGCTKAAADGCILSYKVSNPTSVVISGSGLNVTTPGTNGCWATGAFIIDNSDPTTSGADQIYFLNLNGAEAGGVSGATSSNCTSATATINATQASQSGP
jgi:hypothetical protein